MSRIYGVIAVFGRAAVIAVLFSFPVEAQPLARVIDDQSVIRAHITDPSVVVAEV